MGFIITLDGDLIHEPTLNDLLKEEVRTMANDRADVYTAGTLVQVPHNVSPGRVLSGPHKTTQGRVRYLVERADGNVSLFYADELRKAMTRTEKVARAIYQEVTGARWESAVTRHKLAYLKTAETAVRVADATRGER